MGFTMTINIKLKPWAKLKRLLCMNHLITYD